MTSYRIARRSFLRGVGAGAVGLKVMLRNLEASAVAMAPPPRFLMTHWPVGAIKYRFQPSAPGTTFNFDNAPILKPLEALKSDMIILYGLSTQSFGQYGGGHEAGTPKSSTGASTPGTRSNGGETDDAVSGGPSWDQIFLKTVPGLRTPGVGYVNAICDARVDSNETSTQCLSYDYATRAVAAAQGGSGGSVTEHVPLLPTLSPLQLYNKLFAGFMPGGGTGGTGDMAKLLKARKSVLDCSRTQLARLKALAPASEASKIDIHADAIRKIEDVLTMQISGGTITPGTCALPLAPASTLMGKNTMRNGDYKAVGSGPTTATIDDSVLHDQIGKAHMGIIKTAFMCDLIRVGTFQWSPGTNHVSFKGLYPGDTAGIYMHHPTSHQITDANDSLGTLPPAGLRQDVVIFLANVHAWYNQRMAEILTEWKNTTDVFGGNLLANTIIPYVTEVSQTTHSTSSMPALIFGGSALGMKGGQYQNLNNRSHNDLWISIAQAYFKTATPLTNLPATNADGTINTFIRTGVAPIPGLWAMP